MDKITPLALIIINGTKVADSFRLGYEGCANALLASFIEELEDFTKNSKIAKVQHFADLITVMLNAQQRDDNLFLADILQYELLPFLQSKHS
jgi:hypothetical protein